MALTCLLLGVTVFAQTDSATRLMLEKADDYYTKGQALQAFAAVNNALRINETSYQNNGIPANVLIIARPIYRQVLKTVLEEKNYDLFDEVNARIEKFKDLADDDIKRQIKKIETQYAADIQAAREEAAKAARAQEREEDRRSNELLIQSMTDESRKNNDVMIRTMTNTLNESFDKQAELQERQFSETQKSNHTVLIAILVVCGILVIVFIIVILNIVTASRANARQQAQFEATLKLVAGMQQANNQLLLGGVTDLYGDGVLKSAGSSRWGVDALPAPEMTDSEKAELKELAIACEDKGAKIDQISRRKNNSKNVSELVFKLAQNLGLNQNTAMVYFCAAMVYDIGFLSMPEVILNAENLTDDQLNQLRGHLSNCEKSFEFVPEKYRQIFIDAAKYHNENMDGTGYPSGLKDDDIPQIARLIHVAESYNALISRRSYRAIRDKESAIEEMKAQPGLYDPAVVAVLDAIV
ncbi:MAG: hypothetical protein K6G80_02910 [Treponema sp.]|nr:hypothetical protein [Treponema sp.]